MLKANKAATGALFRIMCSQSCRRGFVQTIIKKRRCRDEFQRFWVPGVPDLRRSNSKSLESLEIVPIFSKKGIKSEVRMER